MRDYQRLQPGVEVEPTSIKRSMRERRERRSHSAQNIGSVASRQSNTPAKNLLTTALELNSKLDPFNRIDGLGWQAIKYTARAAGSAIVESFRNDGRQNGDGEDYPRYLVNGREKVAVPRVGRFTGKVRNVPYTRVQPASDGRPVTITEWRADLSDKFGSFLRIGGGIAIGAWILHGSVYKIGGFDEELTYSEFTGKTVMSGLHGMKELPEVASTIFHNLTDDKPEQQ